ncbi:MAG: hypothetical protein WCK29_04790 [archaeon]
MVNSKHAFWQALLFTIFIFVIGLMVGLFIENMRATNFEGQVSSSETALLDEQIRNNIISDSNLSCDIILNSTFSFADRIYGQAQSLEKYDSVSQLSDSLREIHKRYDLLRILLWNEMQNSQKRCKYQNVHTVVYFFNYNAGDLKTKSVQSAFSHLLTDLKNKYPDNVILIPVASNLNIGSINLILNKYNISTSPALLIDDKKVISDLPSFQELEHIVLQSNKE